MNLWRALFALAAFVNFVAGGAMVIAPRSAAEAIGGNADPASVQFAGWLIFAFGIGYAMVARAPGANRGIVWIGAISKFGAVALTLVAALHARRLRTRGRRHAAAARPGVRGAVRALPLARAATRGVMRAPAMQRRVR